MNKYITWIKKQDHIDLLRKMNYVGVPLFIIFIIVMTYAVTNAYIVGAIVIILLFFILNILLYGVTLFINLRK